MFTSFIPGLNGVLSEGVEVSQISTLIALGILNGFQVTINNGYVAITLWKKKKMKI